MTFPPKNMSHGYLQLHSFDQSYTKTIHNVTMCCDFFHLSQNLKSSVFSGFPRSYLKNTLTVTAATHHPVNVTTSQTCAASAGTARPGTYLGKIGVSFASGWV